MVEFAEETKNFSAKVILCILPPADGATAGNPTFHVDKPMNSADYNIPHFIFSNYIHLLGCVEAFTFHCSTCHVELLLCQKIMFYLF